MIRFLHNYSKILNKQTTNLVYKMHHKYLPNIAYIHSPMEGKSGAPSDAMGGLFESLRSLARSGLCW